MISLDAYEKLFEEHGGTDIGYLRNHWSRFRNTKIIFERGRHPGLRNTVLDIGAHWLHQALLFALDGYRVTAADLPDTMEHPHVVRLAHAHDIRLVRYQDLAHTSAFADLPDASFDVIILAEVLEHIAFNPVELWREMYRLLAEGGTLLVTTPNYYAMTRRKLAESRALFGGGAGITVEEILNTPTHGHHWKEYSRRELGRYFQLLSPDFVIERMIYVEDEPSSSAPWGRKLAASVRGLIPPMRSRLHLEIGLPKKRNGIVVAPRW